MTTTATHRLPMILTEVETVRVERLSPSFVRIELAAPELADFGVDGPLHDQRIKLVFPNARGELPSFADADESWFGSWLAIPAEERGHMRTYTVREVRGAGPDTRLVVDIVLHADDGTCGPGASWAATARPGDRLVLLGPRRGEEYGGIEFDAGTARDLLLIGDETAVPAVCAILADLPAGARGTAFLEVPVAEDVQEIDAPVGVEVVWLPRDGAEHGARHLAAVRHYFGLPAPVEPVADDAVDPDLWETPGYSSSGEELSGPAATDLPGLYAWIAGESKVVTTLRRCLVSELGLDRRQVAFMGYWRRGVAMRS